MKKNLILTGMMGVGKSSIGRDLSSKLNMEFKDIDIIIEKKLSLSISKIFKMKGEKFFREIEEKETIAYLNKKNTVIALGGGAFINQKIRDETIKSGISFWLDLDAKVIFQRIKVNMKRPLLSSNTSENEIKKLCKSREMAYSLSNYRIDCNAKNKNQIIKEILNIYESK
mgnify:CR=1 FL=1